MYVALLVLMPARARSVKSYVLDASASPKLLNANAREQRASTLIPHALRLSLPHHDAFAQIAMHTIFCNCASPVAIMTSVGLSLRLLDLLAKMNRQATAS